MDKTETEPTRPPETKYSTAFERCWKVHRVGTKKAAWNAGNKADWDDGNWLWMENYLEERHRLDAKWLEGTYIPMLSTMINGERWTDQYKYVKAGRQTESPQHTESHAEALAKIAITDQTRQLH